VTTGLVTSLGEPRTAHGAARAMSEWVCRYPGATDALGDALVARLLAQSTRPLALLDGLDQLASMSSACRRGVLQQCFDAVCASLLSGQAIGFDEVQRAMHDVERLRGLIEESPYRNALEAAFPSPAPAQA
jgi:hypothetical protein